PRAGRAEMDPATSDARIPLRRPYMRTVMAMGPPHPAQVLSRSSALPPHMSVLLVLVGLPHCGEVPGLLPGSWLVAVDGSCFAGAFGRAPVGFELAHVSSCGGCAPA